MGQRSESGGAAFWDFLVRRGFSIAQLNITGNMASGGGTAFTVVADMPPIIRLGATAARNVRLPLGSTVQPGQIFLLQSSSASTTGVLTVLTSTGGALVPALTIAQNAAALVQYWGPPVNAWKKLNV